MVRDESDNGKEFLLDIAITDREQNDASAVGLSNVFSDHEYKATGSVNRTVSRLYSLYL